MAVEILVKGRFRELPDATVSRVAGNAWSVRVKRTEAVARVVRGDLSKGLDQAILVVDDQECEPAVVSAEGKDAVTVSVWAL